jgi:hypothetical protein
VWVAAIANFLQTSITRIELSYGALSLGCETGFFLKMNGDWFLVSNWHVFSGRDANTGQARNKDRIAPDACAFFTFELSNNKLITRQHQRALGDLSTGTATWFQHPSFGQRVDVGALPLENFVPGKAKDLLDPTGHDDSMWIDLGGELFLPGYPLGLAAPGGMAIWKRASLATSTEFGEGMDRFVLVDTASREGMSGAPCLALANWQYYALDRATGKMNVKNRPLSCRLLGVYSGRLNARDDLGAQLGVVWRENLIFETIEGRQPAQVNFA